MLRLQHLLRFALRTFGFCNLAGVRVNNEGEPIPILKGVRRGAPPFLHFVHLALAICSKLVPPAHMLVEESALYCRENDEYSFTLFYTLHIWSWMDFGSWCAFPKLCERNRLYAAFWLVSLHHDFIYTLMPSSPLTTTEIAQFISPVFFFYCSGVILWSGVLYTIIISFVRAFHTKCFLIFPLQS